MGPRWSGSPWLGVRVTGLVAVAAGLAVVAGGLAVPPAWAAPRPGPAPALPRLSPATGAGALPVGAVRAGSFPVFRPSGTSWPSASSGVVSVAGSALPPALPGAAPAPAVVFASSGPGRGLSGAAGTPVLAGVAGLSGGPSSVAVSALGHQVAVAAGVRGVVFTARAAGPGGLVRVGLDYAGFRDVSGGNYGLGLGLEVLPACALTTPQVAKCRIGRPLASVNDASAMTVSAVVSLPGAPAAALSPAATGGTTAIPGALVVLAAAPAFTDGGGSAGTYNATSLRASGTWAAGGSDGSFTYSYPMAVPPSAGGLEPQVGLGYSSGSVDGQTASSQAQPSWVGDGWSTPQAFIEQSFTACTDSPEGSASPHATNDQCYDGPVLTLSLNGSSTPLVCPVPFSYTANSTCTAATDNGEVVTHHVSSGNGTGSKFTDYWTVTERSGTTYSFGLNHLPGWATGKTATNSADWVPVFSAHSGDPCYNATWASSVCKMTYRWNLDYVTNLHGDAMAYYYLQDSNAYAQNAGTSVSYIRDSHLDHIDYGFTNGNAYASSAPDQVSFTTGYRCFTGTCSPLNATNAPNWPDTPYVQDYCASGKTGCPTAPSFWSTVSLASVTTKQWNGTSYVTVDSWVLSQSFPATGDGTSPALWLKSVARTGSDTTAGGGAVPLPAVSFGTPLQLANRLNPGTYPALDRMRIQQITTETGSQISVAYAATAPCTPASPPSPSGNALSCFPVLWSAFPTTPDWFVKYAATSVSVSDPAGGSPGTYQAYTYSRPTWHYDDNEVVKTKYRTYGQWRAYGDVITYTGTGTDPQTQSETTYYQGMSDDNNTTAVTLTDSQGGKHDDTNQLSGNVLESTAYTFKGGPVDHSAIYSYWVSPAVASRSRTSAGLPALTANFTGQVEQWARQAITDTSPATWRVTEADTSYDTNLTSPTAGMPLFAFDHGDISDPSQQRCTAISYAPANTAENLAGLPSETETDALPCGGSSPNGASAPGVGQVNALTAPSGRAQGNIVSDTRVFYDSPAMAATWPQPASPAWPQATAPTLGDVSVTQQATGYSGGTFTYQTKSAAVYDSYGRVTSAWDGNGGFNGTTYTPTTIGYTMTNGSTNAQKATNPLGQSVTTTYDPLRGIPVTITDPNGIASNIHYDGLGRVIAAWETGRPVTSGATVTYSYSMTLGAPVIVTTSKLDDAGGYVTSYALYDSLLRPRQTQSPTPAGGFLVSDSFYDSRGWAWKANSNWWFTGTGGTSVVTVPDSQVSQQAVTAYDGLGRPVIGTSYENSNIQRVGYTQYTGAKVTTTMTGATISTPSGATPKAVTADALGRTTELDSYTTAPTVATGTNAGGFPAVTITGGAYQATTYSYETRGWRSAVTDVATGEKWARTYNSLGQVVSSTDPNAGGSSMSYDADGHLITATNGDGKTVSYTYDPLGRKTGQYDGANPAASPQIASWTYDNSNNAVPGMANPIGQVTTATSTYGGSTYSFQQTGFNVFGEALGQKVTLPAAEGTMAGTYSMSHIYSTNTGLPGADSYPASPNGAALPAETVGYGYIPGFDMVKYVSSNLASYTNNISWNAYFQIAQNQIGSNAASAWITNTFDPNTGALTNSQVANTAISSTPFDSTSYSYDPSGNLTSQTAVRNGTATETQCFSYDLLRRLTTAWTTNGTPACSSGPSTGTGGTVGDGIAGGAYWMSWVYSPLGDQQTQTQHNLTGGSDTVTSYTYNNGGGTASGQPDTLTSSATTGPGAGTASYAYDPAGNTTARNLPSGNQTLTWYDNGLLATDTTTAGTTSYVYDPSGKLLLQKDPGKTTLYLFGEQLVLNTTTGAVTGTRFLALPGGVTAVRTGAGAAYWFELTDLHGTSLLTLDSTANNPVWRQQTPYGAPRGTGPGSWPDTNGYLGKPTDQNTGLTIIGARNYDPGLGRFISTDPVFQAGSPQTMNGYSYSGDNPVTFSDPTGLRVCLDSVCASANTVARIVHVQEVNSYNSLAAAALNQTLGHCNGIARCELHFIHAFKDPYYVGNQINSYIGHTLYKIQQEENAAAAARQRAQQDNCGFWCSVTHFVAAVAPIIMAIAVVTAFIPVLGEIDLLAGVIAQAAELIDTVATVASVASDVVNAANVVTSGSSGVMDIASGNFSRGFAELGSAALSAVGIRTGVGAYVGKLMASQALVDSVRVSAFVNRAILTGKYVSGIGAMHAASRALEYAKTSLEWAEGTDVGVASVGLMYEVTTEPYRE